MVCNYRLLVEKIKKLPNREQEANAVKEEQTLQDQIHILKKENAELKRQLEERQGFFDIRCGDCGKIVHFWIPTEMEKNMSAVKSLEKETQKTQTIFPVKSKCFIS